MKIVYLSRDEVNQFLVRRWVKASGMRMTPPNRPHPADAKTIVAAMILDLDSLPPHVDLDHLRQMRSEQMAVPMMVHGHNIPDRLAAELRNSGIRVCRGRVRQSVVRGWLDSVVACHQVV